MAKNRDVEFDFFELDENELVEEWKNQPKIYFKYSELLTNAKEALERCKAQLEIAGDELKEAKARVDLRIRKNPKKLLGSDEKPTEAQIANRIIVHPLYAKAKAKIYKLNEELITLNKKVSTFYSAVHALDHRKSALERLVSLHGQNYYATPRPIDEASFEDVANLEKAEARLAGKKRREGKKSKQVQTGKKRRNK